MAYWSGDKRDGAELEDSMGVKRPRVDEESAEITIPQQFVGWLKGKAGRQVQEIEKKSGATVTIDQGTKDLGYSQVMIRGGAANVQAAADFINSELRRVMDRDQSGAPNLGSEAEECQIPQKYVGWLKGAGGSQLVDMENKTGASVRIDQSSRDLGYSIAHISGTPEAVAACRALIESELTRVQERDRVISEHAGGAGPVSGMAVRSAEPNEVRIPQQYVGWIKGSGGAQIKDIEVRTGAHVTIDQSTKDQGYSRALLYGDPICVRAAREIIDNELKRVSSRDSVNGPPPSASPVAVPPRLASGGGAPSSSGASPEAIQNVVQLLTAAATGNQQQLATALTSLVVAAAAKQAVSTAAGSSAQPALTNAPAAAPPPRPAPTRPERPRDPNDTGEWDIVRIPNTCVGWLKGRQGGMIREIENRSGCQIDIDQTTKDQGYSTATVHGDMAQKKIAYGLIIAEVAKVLDQSGEVPEADFVGVKSEFQIDTQYVGWVKGPRGKVVQDIQMKTGTRIDVDQNTRDLGFATVKIFGTLEGTQQARVLVASELSKISPEASQDIVKDVPGGPEALQVAISQARASGGHHHHQQHQQQPVIQQSAYGVMQVQAGQQAAAMQQGAALQSAAAYGGLTGLPPAVAAAAAAAYGQAYGQPQAFFGQQAAFGQPAAYGQLPGAAGYMQGLAFGQPAAQQAFAVPGYQQPALTDGLVQAAATAPAAAAAFDQFAAQSQQQAQQQAQQPQQQQAPPQQAEEPPPQQQPQLLTAPAAGFPEDTPAEAAAQPAAAPQQVQAQPPQFSAQQFAQSVGQGHQMQQQQQQVGAAPAQLLQSLQQLASAVSQVTGQPGS